MKTFFLLRHEDIHGKSGIGVVAEGVIFDTGMCSMTWFGPYPTVTIFPSIKVVEALHGHGGLTEVVVDSKRNKTKYAACLAQVALNKCIAKNAAKKASGT